MLMFLLTFLDRFKVAILRRENLAFSIFVNARFTVTSKSKTSSLAVVDFKE